VQTILQRLLLVLVLYQERIVLCYLAFFFESHVLLPIFPPQTTSKKMPLNPNQDYIEKALIANCSLILDEFSENHVKQIRDSIFRQGQLPGANGLEKQAWFQRVAQGTSAVREQGNRNRPNRRLIAWKTGKPFEAQNLFFRTVDTSRLLPAALANFRIQWYAPRGIWDQLDSKKPIKEIPQGGRKGFQMYMLAGFVCFLFLFPIPSRH
jgi:hypothetical protein